MVCILPPTCSVCSQWNIYRSEPGPQNTVRNNWTQQIHRSSQISPPQFIKAPWESAECVQLLPCCSITDELICYWEAVKCWRTQWTRYVIGGYAHAAPYRLRSKLHLLGGGYWNRADVKWSWRWKFIRFSIRSRRWKVVFVLACFKQI